MGPEMFGGTGRKSESGSQGIRMERIGRQVVRRPDGKMSCMVR